MKKAFNRGFTLIELLVVIAIIGILASVVLASLNTARDKGTNAAVQASLNSFRAQAEIDGSQANGTIDYSSVCTSTNGAQIIADIDAKIGGTATCYDGQGDWAIETGLLDGAGFICIDSEGNSVTNAASQIGADTDGNRDCT